MGEKAKQSGKDSQGLGGLLVTSKPQGTHLVFWGSGSAAQGRAEASSQASTCLGIYPRKNFLPTPKLENSKVKHIWPLASQSLVKN
jgi:hypothetical protein